MTPQQQLDAFMEVCKTLPGFEKEEYGSVERNILSGVYSFDPVDQVLEIEDGWRIKIQANGQFVPIEES
jgi:hypothetical protein